MGLEDSLKEEIRVALAGLAIFAVYLPVALVLGSGYTPVPRPSGSVVIPLLKIEHDSGSSYQSEPFALKRHAGVVLYEDMQLLGDANFATKDKRKLVIFSTSDGSDPRTNGRKYWLVLP